MEYRTIRDILTNAEKCFGNEDAIRYKTGKNEIAAKTYTQLKEDSERITALLKNWEIQKSYRINRCDFLSMDCFLFWNCGRRKCCSTVGCVTSGRRTV